LFVRRLPTVLALLGCLIHAMVLPWYAASQSAAHSSAAALAADLSVICHGGLAAKADGRQPGLPQQPSGPIPDCPICKGLVGLHFAVLAVHEIRLLEPVAIGDLVPPAGRGLNSQIVFSPRNRGPPSLL
jgi:hypothetical protein